MPNWKKVIVSGSDAILNEITSSGGILTSQDIMPDVDNTLSLGSSTQRFQLNGGTPVTVTGSGTANTITRFNGATEVENSTITNSDTLTTIIHDNDGNDIFIVSGSNGELIKVTDTISDTLFQVNDGSGISQFEVSSSGTLIAQNLEYTNETFVLTYNSQSGNINFFSASAIVNYGDSDVTDHINSLGVLSSSLQIASEISGAFDSVSASLASDISSIDSNVTLQDATDNGNTTTNSITTTNSVFASTFTGSLLRLDENGTGMRMTNVGAFENASGTFHIFSNGDLRLSTNGSGAGTTAVTFDQTTKNADFVGEISSSDVNINDWGSVSASLASLDASTYNDSDVTDHINTLNVHSGSHLGTATTDDLSEGSTNLYYTDTRVKTKLNAEGVISGSEQIEDVVGGMLTGNTETNITVTYQDSDGTIDFDVDDATATQKGVIEIATNSEVTTGTDTSRAITPSSLTSITKLGTITTGNVDAILPSGVVSGSVSSPSQGTLSVNGNNIDLGLQTGDSPTFNDLLVTGNLTVEGSRTELQVSELNVEDINITIASGAANSAAADGAGITIDGANESLTWNHANSRFQFSDDLRVDGLLNIGSVSNAGTDTDKFLVLDSNGNVDYRTGAQVLSDIGGVGNSNGITGEGSTDSIGYSQNGTDYYSLARFSGSSSEVTGSSDLDFFISDTTLVSGPIRRGIQFGRGTGTSTRFDETGFVVSQGTNTNGLPQDTVNVLLQENGSGDTYFSILTGGSSTLALGTGDDHRLFITGSSSNGNGGTRIGIGGFSGDANPFNTSGENIDDTLHIKGGLKVEKPTTSGTSAGVNFATNVRITGSLFVSASNTFTNQGPAVFSGSIAVADGDQVQATTDTDKFLVLDGDQIKYRSGAQVRSDIGAASSGVTLQNVTDNGNSTTGVINMSNFTISSPTNNNGASDKILVLDGSNRSKIRTRDQLRDDIGALQATKTPQIVVTAAEVLDEGLLDVYIPFSGINIFPESNVVAYSRFHAPYDGYIKEIIVHPHEAGSSGNCRITPTIDGTSTTPVQASISGTAGTPTTFSFGSSGYSFSDGDDIYLAFDRVANDRSKGFSFTIVFIMDATS